MHAVGTGRDGTGRCVDLGKGWHRHVIMQLNCSTQQHENENAGTYRGREMEEINQHISPLRMITVQKSILVPRGLYMDVETSEGREDGREQCNMCTTRHS